MCIRDRSEAVYMAFRHNLSIVTGPPGTGKTTILRAIIEVFKRLFPESKIMLAAPTGRASRRMVESTGVEAKTLHSLLGLVGEDMEYGKGTRKEPLDAGLIIIDETSMVDMWLAPVSYTHLDVYKRQGMVRSPALVFGVLMLKEHPFPSP